MNEIDKFDVLADKLLGKSISVGCLDGMADSIVTLFITISGYFRLFVICEYTLFSSWMNVPWCGRMWQGASSSGVGKRTHD